MPGAERKVRVRFFDGGQWVSLDSDYTVSSVPQAVVAETLQNKTPSDFIQKSDASNLTQTNMESVFARFTKLDALLNNTDASGSTLNTSISGNASTATNISGVVAIANGGTGATTANDARASLGLGSLATIAPTGIASNGTYLRGDNTWSPVKFSDIKNALGNSAFVGMGTCTVAQTVKWSSLTDTFECQDIALSASQLTSGTINSSRLPVASGTSDGIVNQLAQSFAGIKTFLNNVIMQGTLTVSGNISSSGNVAGVDVSASGNVSGVNLAASGLVSADRIKVANSTATCDAANEGSIRYNSTSKKMEFCNGTTWGLVSQGTLASVAISGPSSSIVKAGPVTFTVTYGSSTDTATINLLTGHITIGGSATTDCAVTSVSDTDYTRTVTIDGCSGTGTVNISVAGATASSTTSDPASAAGPSTSYQVDNTGPNAPTGVSLGSVPTNFTNSPTITYTAASDVGGSTVSNHQIKIVKTSDTSVIIKDWSNHTSGSDVGSLTLNANTQYSIYVRAVDALGNNGTPTTAINWTSINDPCSGSPTPGTVCAGGSIYLGSLSPGATSGSGTDKYMITPGGCGEIPAGQIVGSGASAYPNAEFTPTCSGTDTLTKTWNDGSSNFYDIPGLTNYTTTVGLGDGSSNTDQYYGSSNTTNIVAITSSAQGGYHAAALYCDLLNYGGYNDWYLPNRYELNLVWTNVASVPGLDTNSYYWSSTEYDNLFAWAQRFANGYRYGTHKNVYYHVRCVRRF